MSTGAIGAGSTPTKPEAVSASDISSGLLIARMERIPTIGFHTKARLVIGSATFFDAYDALTISFILPVLVPLWHLVPTQTGLIISSGYLGQFLGAVFFGWLAERKGRLFSLQATIIVIAIGALGCMISQDYNMLFGLRFIQGIGLGGEVPVAAAYIAEITKAKGRGRFVLLYQWAFSLGIWFASITSALLVPTIGWRAMFLIGAVPSLVLILIRRTMPESPRWLANHGDLEAAEKAVSFLENEARKEGKELEAPVVRPPVAMKQTRFMELFEGVYFKRTIAMWFMWAGSYFWTYGLSQTWGPTIYTTWFHLTVPNALWLGTAMSTINLPISLFIYWNLDKIPRRVAFITSLIGGGLILTAMATASLLGILTLPVYVFGFWLTGTFVGINNLGLYLYNPEVYPTRLRALGTSVATGWLRLASAVGPTLTGIVMQSAGLTPIFYIIAAGLLISGLVAFWGAPETHGRVLEDVSA